MLGNDCSPHNDFNLKTMEKWVQQTKLAACTRYLMEFKKIVKIGFAPLGYKAALKQCLTEAITGEYPNYGMAYSKLKMSVGLLKPPSSLRVNLGSEISLTWRNNANRFNAFSADRLQVVYFNETRQECWHYDKGRRMDESAAFAVPFEPIDQIHLWIFFTRYDGKESSNSRYLKIANPSLPKKSKK